MEFPKTNNTNQKPTTMDPSDQAGSGEVQMYATLPPTGKEIVPEKSKKSNKISDIVKLKQMLKKWRKQAHSSTTGTSDGNTTTDTDTNNNNSNSNGSKKGSLSRSNSMKGITFLKRTLSFTDVISAAGASSSSSGNTNSNTNNNNSNNNGSKKGSLSRSNSIKGITFLKRTLSFTDVIPAAGASSSSNAISKGFLAVDVGEEMKRFVIPTNYLSHKAFGVLLKEAEEEFGFQQEGVLRIPCEVEVFESILKVVEAKNRNKQTPQLNMNDGIVCGSSESHSISHSLHPPSPMCR